MLNQLAQALMQNPTDQQIAQMRQQQNGPMGGMFGNYQQFQPYRDLLQQGLQSRPPTLGAQGAATPQMFG
jgi:hypothetical protein